MSMTAVRAAEPCECSHASGRITISLWGAPGVTRGHLRDIARGALLVAPVAGATPDDGYAHDLCPHCLAGQDHRDPT